MKTFASLLAVALLAAAPAFATSHAPAPAQAASSLADGEVRKVDKDAGKVTIKHGAIANLEMPPMTMVFRVKDPSMLDRMKAGDAIRFRAEKVGGNYTVTEIKAAK